MTARAAARLVPWWSGLVPTRQVGPLAAALLVALCIPAASANAELVYLASGRTLSVKAYRVEDGRATLTLRSGGEIDCDAALIIKVEPDEVPWPEPIPTPLATMDSALAAETTPFDNLIGPLAERHGVEAALVRAVIATESAFEPGARSPKGAMGLMQLMPATARQYSVENPYEPLANLDAGIRHLKGLLDRYEIRVALAAYNAGEATIQRYGGIPPYAETRSYVERVLRRLSRYRGQTPGATTSGATAGSPQRTEPSAPANGVRPAAVVPTS